MISKKVHPDQNLMSGMVAMLTLNPFTPFGDLLISATEKFKIQGWNSQIHSQTRDSRMAPIGALYSESVVRVWAKFWARCHISMFFSDQGFTVSLIKSLQ